MKDEVIIDDGDDEEKSEVTEHGSQDDWGQWQASTWKGQDKWTPPEAPKKMAAKARPMAGEGSRPKKARVDSPTKSPQKTILAPPPPPAPPAPSAPSEGKLAAAPSSGPLTGGAENAKAGLMRLVVANE